MMGVGVGASVACYRDTFAKGLHDGLKHTLEVYDPKKANFDFAQTTVRLFFWLIYLIVFETSALSRRKVPYLQIHA